MDTFGAPKVNEVRLSGQVFSGLARIDMQQLVAALMKICSFGLLKRWAGDAFDVTTKRSPVIKLSKAVCTGGHAQRITSLQKHWAECDKLL